MYFKINKQTNIFNFLLACTGGIEIGGATDTDDVIVYEYGGTTATLSGRGDKLLKTLPEK